MAPKRRHTGQSEGKTTGVATRLQLRVRRSWVSRERVSGVRRAGTVRREQGGTQAPPGPRDVTRSEWWDSHWISWRVRRSWGREEECSDERHADAVPRRGDQGPQKNRMQEMRERGGRTSRFFSSFVRGELHLKPRNRAVVGRVAPTGRCEVLCSLRTRLCAGYTELQDNVAPGLQVQGAVASVCVVLRGRDGFGGGVASGVSVVSGLRGRGPVAFVGDRR